MRIEPWTIGTAVELPVAGTVLGVIGPVPGGVRVLYVSFFPEGTRGMQLAVGVSVGEAPARVFQDMATQRQLFPLGLSSFVDGPSEMLVNVASGFGSERRWYWNLEVLAGPMWVSVVVAHESTGSLMVAMGLVGFRRIKADEDP